MLTFALDTSTASPSLALVRDEIAVAELWLAPEPGAGRRVLEAGHGLMVAAGARMEDVGEIVVGVGPGGFTGLRIGIATALGLGQALGVPVIGAVSLEALALDIARDAPEGALLVPVLDARRRELFAAAYRREGDDLAEVWDPRTIAPPDLAAALASPEGRVIVGGEGVGAAGDALDGTPATVRPAGAHRVGAAALVARVRAGAGRPARPVYARLPDAEVNRRRALAAEAS